MRLDSDFMKALQKERVERAEKLDKCRRVLMRELCAAGVKSVHVDFDGYGDSGGLEKPVLDPPIDTSTEVGDTPHEVREWFDGGSRLVVRNYTIGELLNEVCYGILSNEHGGWEINEGSYGTFSIDPARDRVSLSYNQRIESVESYDEEF
jgi:hypothetical protein